MRILTLAALAVLSSAAHAVYVYDDGTFENGIGLTAGGPMVWANQFTVEAGLESITGAGIAFDAGAALTTAAPFTVVLWSDPNGDGSPVDATILASVNVGVPANWATEAYTNFSFAAPVNLTVGQNFFLGISMNHAAGTFPAAIDQTSTAGKSWIGLAADWTGTTGVIDTFGFPGNWAIRGTAQPVPEPATMAALGLGIAAIARRRKSAKR